MSSIYTILSLESSDVLWAVDGPVAAIGKAQVAEMAYNLHRIVEDDAHMLKGRDEKGILVRIERCNGRGQWR